MTFGTDHFSRDNLSHSLILNRTNRSIDKLNPWNSSRKDARKIREFPMANPQRTKQGRSNIATETPDKNLPKIFLHWQIKQETVKKCVVMDFSVITRHDLFRIVKIHF